MASYADTLFGGQSTSAMTQKSPVKKKTAMTPTAPGVAPSGAVAPITPTQTFAQLQAQGVARPAPPPIPKATPMAQYGGSAQGQVGRDALQTQVQQALAAPTRYDLDTYKTIRDASKANLDADYASSRESIDEEMARRGLFDSSYASTKYKDLAGQQARALADLDATLLKDAAATQMSDRLGAAGMSSQLGELAGSQDLAAFEANRVGQALDFENALRAALAEDSQYQSGADRALDAAKSQGELGLGEGALDLGRDELGLKTELGRGELGLSRDRLNQEADLTREGRAFSASESDLERKLQELMQSRSLDFSREGLAQEADLTREGRTFAAGESDLERKLQELMQSRSLDFSREGLAQEGEQFERTAGQTDLARELQERLATGELTGRIDGQNTVERDRVTADADLARQNLLGQLLGMLGLTGIQDLLKGGGTTGGTRPPVGTGGTQGYPVIPPSGGEEEVDEFGRPTGTGTDGSKEGIPEYQLQALIEQLMGGKAYGQ